MEDEISRLISEAEQLIGVSPRSGKYLLWRNRAEGFIGHNFDAKTARILQKCLQPTRAFRSQADLQIDFNERIARTIEFLEELTKHPAPPAQQPTLLSTARIDTSGLPAGLLASLDELNDNLDRNNVNASALLIRQIMTKAVILALQRSKKESQLLKDDGSDRELTELLRMVQQAYSIPPQTISRVISAKWIGDSANHSYRISLNEGDVERAATALRILIDELELRK